MYVHYQQAIDPKNSREPWKIVKLGLENEVPDMKHMTVFAVSNFPLDGNDDTFIWEDQTYIPLQGLPFDIDGPLPQAIAEMQSLLDVLVKHGVDLSYVRVYASGSKGFHVNVPFEYFGQASLKGVKFLPQIFRSMVAKLAEQAGLKLLDMNMYKGKRGQMLRVANALRQDGKYKVPLTVAEARTITHETYAHYTSAPRYLDVPALPKEAIAPGLTALYNRAKESVGTVLHNGTKTQSVPSEVLAKLGDSTVPRCVQWIMEGDRCKAESFNAAAMQIEIYLTKSSLTAERAEEVREQVARNVKSDRMRSFEDRRSHLRELTRTVDRESYQFSCGAMRKMLMDHPCAGCPIQQAQVDQIEERTGLQVLPSGYFVSGPNGVSKEIMNFVLEPAAVLIATTGTHRQQEAYEFVAKREGREVQRLVVHRSQWDSSDAFKAVMNIVPNGVVKANNDQIMELKRILTSETTEVDVMEVTHEAGIHRHTVYKGGPLATAGDVDFDTNVWVEPGWSRNALNGMNTHQWAGKGGETVIQFQNLDSATPQDPECADMLSSLLTLYRPEVIGTLLGWTVACNLKHHLMTIGNEFPLMHLYGPPGSGKTKTAQVVTALAGADYRKAPMVMNNSTPYPLKEALSSTTTVPRIFDECRPAGFSNPRHWLMVRDLLKAAYQGSEMATGTVRAGSNRIQATSADSIRMRALAPVIYTSTEETDDDELVSRSIALRFGQDPTSQAQAAAGFEAILLSGWVPLFRLGRLLVMSALKLSQDDVSERLQFAMNHTPGGMLGRLRKNLGVVLLGQGFLREVLSKDLFSQELIDALWAIEDATVQWWNNNAGRLITNSNVTEIEKVFQTLSDLAASRADGVNSPLVPGLHYVLKDNSLSLHTHCWTPYRMFCRSLGENAAFSTFSKFERLVEGRSYFVGKGGLSGQASSAGWVTVDFSKIRELVDVSGFKPTK